MPFCIGCGTKLEDSLKFCPQCGANQSAAPAPKKAVTKKPVAEKKPGKTVKELELELQLMQMQTAAAAEPEKVKRNMRNADVAVRCSKCGSTEVTTQEKGFGLGKAAVGGLLLGPVGLAAGMLGRKKVKLICLKCGHKWMAGKR